MWYNFVWIGGAAVALYLLLVAGMFLFQRRMLYYPSKDFVFTPEDVGLKYEEIIFRTRDKKRLHGWYIPHERASFTLLFCHGNAGNISGRVDTINVLYDLGLNIFVFDYRGYGKSEGRPSEKGTYRDVEAAWQYLVEQKKVAPETIIVMGRSLGGPVAAWLANRVQPAGLIVESAFTSLSDIARVHYPWLPVRWMLRHRYPTQEYLQQVRCPTLLAHSREDRLIPFIQGKSLYHSAGGPKQFLAMKGFHGEAFIQTGPRYTRALQRFINSLNKE